MVGNCLYSVSLWILFYFTIFSFSFIFFFLDSFHHHHIFFFIFILCHRHYHHYYDHRQYHYFHFLTFFFFSPISGTLLFRLFSRFTVIYFAGLLHCMEKYGFIRMLFNKGNTLYDYILCICVSECVCRVHARAHAHTCIICKIYMHARRSCVYTILNVCTNHFNLSKRQIQYS